MGLACCVEGTGLDAHGECHWGRLSDLAAAQECKEEEVLYLAQVDLGDECDEALLQIFRTLQDAILLQGEGHTRTAAQRLTQIEPLLLNMPHTPAMAQLWRAYLTDPGLQAVKEEVNAMSADLAYEQQQRLLGCRSPGVDQ